MAVFLKLSPVLIDKKPELITGKFLSQPLPIKPFSLINQYQEDFNKEDLQNKWSILFFGYTNCPDVCPTTIYKLSEIQKKIAQKKELNDQLQVILITLDPKRDSVTRLREYLAFFGPSLIGLTGNDSEISKITSNLSVYFEQVGEEKQYDFNHTASIFLIGPEGTVIASFSPASKSEELTQDILNIIQ